MITTVHYGLGNLKSIRDMLGRADLECVISSKPDEPGAASKLIRPGVGHFRFGMRFPHEWGLVEVLNERVLAARVPIVGICVGAQLLGRERSRATPPASTGYETSSPGQSMGS
jgi:glutamine amidotransferase